MILVYPGNTWRGGSYSSAEKQSLYSTAPADWANMICKHKTIKLIGSKYFYVSLTIQLKHLIYLYTVKFQAVRYDL